MARTCTWTAVLLLGLISTSLAGHAASFDCTEAASRAEKLICAEGELSKLDDDLAFAYSIASVDPDLANQVRRDQRQWLVMRNGCGDMACIKSAYTRRLADLLALANNICSKVTDANWPAYQSCVEQKFNTLRASVEKKAKELLEGVEDGFAIRLAKSQGNWERYADDQCALQWNFVRGGMGHTYWMACMNAKFESRFSELTALQGVLSYKQR